VVEFLAQATERAIESFLAFGPYPQYKALKEALKMEGRGFYISGKKKLRLGEW